MGVRLTMTNPTAEQRETARDLAHTICDFAVFFCTRCGQYGKNCTCVENVVDRAEKNISSILEKFATTEREAGRRAGLEEAAKECDHVSDCADTDVYYGAVMAADRIRSLIPSEPPIPETK
jgi:hypothetical protein